MSSYSQTIMKDQRVVAEGAQVVTAPESTLEFTQSYPGSLAVGSGASVGDVIFQEYTPEVQETVCQLIESVELVHTETIPTLFESFGELISETSGAFGKSLEAVSEASGRAAEAGMRATDILGEKLQETQLGQAAILPGVAKYVLIAAVIIIVAGKVWK